jgi:polyhydroxyalkanoate synthesis regulator phasin
MEEVGKMNNSKLIAVIENMDCYKKRVRENEEEIARLRAEIAELKRRLG